MIDTSQSAVRRLLRAARIFLLALALLAPAFPLRAQIIFDVFVGHGLGVADSTVSEGAWFPVTCEIQNDGPSFNGLVEITGGQFGNGQARRIAIELPTGTKKRFSVPLYCTSRYRVTVDATLLNEKGTKVIAGGGLAKPAHRQPLAHPRRRGGDSRRGEQDHAAASSHDASFARFLPRQSAGA
jgi:hypothetical protein